MKSVICFGGVDPSGGAGLSADLKTLSTLGVHGSSIVTAVTAQNNGSFIGYTAMTAQEIRDQWQSVIAESSAKIIKIGLIPNNEVLLEVFACIAGLPEKPLVIYDPVLATSSGFAFSLDLSVLKENLKHVDLLTPNIPELKILFGTSYPVSKSLALGCKSILIKGGHGEDPTHCHDFWSNGESSLDLYSPRKPHKFRGTGCTLASAIAGFYARTDDLRESLVLAKSFINQCMAEATSPYLSYSSWPKANILPTTAINKYKFLDCGPKPLGFYPIVDRAQWLEKLLPLGVSTIQLRIKDLSSTELEKEIVKAVRLARQYSCRLFINDYWELAVKHQAYGVHLGQEDLETADLNLINSSGLRLGISTHNYEEASHAAAFSPSYVALGPIYETTAKKMKFAPQGLDKLEIWAQLFSCPVVAIGGLDLERGRLCLRSGASGVAVMSGITQNKKPMTAAKDWMQLATTLPTSLQPA